jgi:hypothetical protein
MENQGQARRIASRRGTRQQRSSCAWKIEEPEAIGWSTFIRRPSTPKITSGEQIRDEEASRIDRSQLDTHAPTSISKTTNRRRAHVEEEKKRGQIMEAKVIFPKGKNHA